MQSSKITAVLAYLLLLLGPLYVLLMRKQDQLALYHAKQALTILLFVIAAPIAWLIVAWILIFIPYAGPVVGMAIFGLVIATYIFLFFTWIRGIINAWQAKIEPLPVVGKWAERLPIG